MATLKTDQNDLCILYRLDFPNGLNVTVLASPLSPGAGREVLGAFSEDYTLIGVIGGASRVYPFLRGVRIGESYIRDRLNVDPPISSLLFEIMPQLTAIELPDLILQRAERWYNSFYQIQQGELPNV
jgi:hypothetical protein